jgi:hypothetical protein
MNLNNQYQNINDVLVGLVNIQIILIIIEETKISCLLLTNNKKL